MKAEDWVDLIEEFTSEATDPDRIVNVALVVTSKAYDGEIIMRVYGRGDMDAMHATFRELGHASSAALAKVPMH